MRLFNDKFSEQAALSLAVGVVGMSCYLLDRTQHGYGWKKNPFEDTVVYHTGGRSFWKRAIYLESFLEIQNLDLPKFKGSPLLFNPILFHQKLRHNFFYKEIKFIYNWWWTLPSRYQSTTHR